MLAGSTFIARVVDPLLHAYVLPTLAVSTELIPGHTLVGTAVILAVGLLFTTIDALAVAVQAMADVHVTV